MITTTNAKSSGDLVALGWTDHVRIEETKAGREVRMPEWVLDFACANVDGASAAAVRKDPDGWRVCDAYLCSDASYDFDDEAMDYDDACGRADEINRERGVVPLFIPSSWAIVGGAT